ncbi:MAG: heme lyase CcmF/NrfE family subunit [Myxococcales bacterium]|nr:heme lyase CcmF/NrfE family subunit [Myxococcales bacterium]
MNGTLTTHSIGSFLLHAGIVVGAFAALASIVGRWRSDGRLMLAGERAGYALSGMMITASLLLVNAFVTHDYANKYVQRYSDNNMPWYYLIASFWGGQAGSLMFWSFVLGICTAIVIWQNREKNRDILPTVIAVLMIVQIFFLSLMVLEANPFATFRITETATNGRGLEPLLQNPAMTFHPPSILSGYVWWTVPFAFAVAALVHKRLDDGWIRTTRGYAVVSWAFLSIGNLFGGMWAYQELGWGGFWGWDPVENASLMPWFTATAYLHSVMIQERRGMLKVWNIALVMVTYFLTVFGTFLTRSGLIDSVHTFAQSDIGGYFMVALTVLAVGMIGGVVWRVRDGSLKSDGRVASLFSREGVFLLNNLVLLGCVGVVMFGTLGEKISAYFWQETKYTAPWFNTWMVPGGLALLVLMGIGPLIPWRKTTWKSFRANLLVPLVVAALGTAAIYFTDAYHLKEHVAATNVPFGEVPLGRLPLVAELKGVYALIGFFGVFFVMYTLIVEFVAGARVRARSTGESYFRALGRLPLKNKRRYGGYLTHLGFGALFLGFIGTGLKTEVDMVFNAVGESRVVEDTQLTFKGIERTENREYIQWDAVFDAHVVDADGQVGAYLGELRPARRNYTGANVRMSRVTTEKDEIMRPTGNVYLALISFRPGFNTAEIMAHFNPMIIWMYIGGGLLLLGVVFALWPEPQPYPVFAAARRRRRKSGEAPAGAEQPGLARQRVD